MGFYKVRSNEWVKPQMNKYEMKCCDCGLIHEVDFRVIELLKEHDDGTAIATIAGDNFRVQFRMRRLGNEQK